MLRPCLWLHALTLMLLWTQTASAHFPWLLTEPAGIPDKVKVFFSEAAEPDDPELLDRLLKADVWVLGGRRGEPQSLSLKKGEDALEADLTTTEQPSAVILRHAYGVVARGGEPFLLKYYGKTYTSPLPGTWRSIKDSVRLALEITPKIDDSATQLRVTWRGEPAVASTVTVTGPGIPSKWEGTTDESRTWRCELPQAGLYSIRARHVETTEGQHEGKTYQSVRHYSTLSLRYLPSRLSPVSHKLPALPNGITSFGGAIVSDALYVYGETTGVLTTIRPRINRVTCGSWISKKPQRGNNC
jgi:hypothetical protein